MRDLTRKQLEMRLRRRLEILEAEAEAVRQRITQLSMPTGQNEVPYDRANQVAGKGPKRNGVYGPEGRVMLGCGHRILSDVYEPAGSIGWFICRQCEAMPKQNRNFKPVHPDDLQAFGRGELI